MITAVRLPIDWSSLGFPDAWRAGAVHLSTGPRAWAWDGAMPPLEVRDAGVPGEAPAVDGWGIDHVVLLLPDLEAGIDALTRTGRKPRRTTVVRGRPTAFFVVGTLLEMIQEEAADRPLLFGVALETEEPLEDVALRWRKGGFHVSDPRPAFQEGRTILTVRNAGAGLAVMSWRVGG